MPIPTNNSGIRVNHLRGVAADYALYHLTPEEIKSVKEASQ